MLSDKLRALREPLVQYASTGVTLPPDTVTKVCNMLQIMQGEARLLEFALGHVPVVALQPPDDASSPPTNIVQLFGAKPARLGERA